MELDLQNLPNPLEGFTAELDQLVADMFREDQLGAVVRVHLRFENLLSRWLEGVVPHPRHIKTIAKTFPGKVDLALCLGLHERLEHPLKKINQLRNEFAHKIDTQIDAKVVSDIYLSFNQEDKELLRTMQRNLETQLPATASEEFTGLNPLDQFRLASAATWVILRSVLANRVYERHNAALSAAPHTDD